MSVNYSKDMQKRKLTFYIASRSDFPLTVRREKNQRNSRVLHAHDYIELVCVYGGSGTHLLNGESFPLREGSVLIIPRDIAHGYEVADDEVLQLFNVLYHPEQLPFDQLGLFHINGFKQLFTPLNNTPVIHFDIGRKNMAQIAALLKQFMAEEEAALPGSQSSRLALATLIMCKIIRFYPGKLLSETPTAGIIRQVQKYLDTHSPAECSISKLTRIAHMSRSNLLKLFKDATGLSPRQYQLQMQLDKACRALKNTLLPVADIAVMCGFVDTNYFSRLFHKHMGVSPRQYRKENK